MQPIKITLVMGLVESGKSRLLAMLPQKETMKFGYITLAGLKNIEIPPNIKNIILTSDFIIKTYGRKQLIKVARELAKRGYYVYIHCYPSEYKWLKAVFNTKES